MTGKLPPPFAEPLRRGSGELRDATAGHHHGDIQPDADDQDRRPDEHEVLDAQRARIHPAPDEGVEAADDPEDAVQRAFGLEEFDDDEDEGDQAGETDDLSEDGHEECSLGWWGF